MLTYLIILKSGKELLIQTEGPIFIKPDENGFIQFDAGVRVIYTSCKSVGSVTLAERSLTPLGHGMVTLRVDEIAFIHRHDTPVADPDGADVIDVPAPGDKE